MDDVGQTLLNWASAFGTLEMVGLLISSCTVYTVHVACKMLSGSQH